MVISTSVTTEMMIAARAITATSPSQFIKGRPLQIARTLRPLPTRLKQQLGRIKDLAAPALSTRELKLGVLSAEKANSIFCLIKYRILLPLISVAAVMLLAACDARVNTVPAEGDKTTIVNPPAKEKTVEHQTTVVTPPAEKK